MRKLTTIEEICFYWCESRVIFAGTVVRPKSEKIILIYIYIWNRTVGSHEYVGGLIERTPKLN